MDKKDSSNKRTEQVRPCMFEHNHVLGEIQEIILREMVEKRSGDQMFFMQCSLCGACGPAGKSSKEAAYRWNARKVKVLDRDEYKRIQKGLSDYKKKKS